MPLVPKYPTLSLIPIGLLYMAASCGQTAPGGSSDTDGGIVGTDSGPIGTDGGPTGGGTGIASMYPFDNNIASDPDVLYADDFESYSTPDDLTSAGHWTKSSWKANLRIATEPENQNPNLDSHKSLEMSLPVSDTEVSTGVVRDLLPTEDVVYARMYQRFDAAYNAPGSNHNGVRISANYPDVAGTAPPEDGTGNFLFLLQNDITGDTPSPGKTQLYVYWPKQRSRINGEPVGMQWGDIWMPSGFTLPYVDAAHEVGADGQAVANRGDWTAFPSDYPDFKPMMDFLPERDKWYCVELMVKSNTPGSADGEVKYWIDGELKGDFPNLNVRSISTLKLNTVHFMLHAGRTTQINKKWYDNVVIAKKYIGPMVRP